MAWHRQTQIGPRPQVTVERSSEMPSGETVKFRGIAEYRGRSPTGSTPIMLVPYPDCPAHAFFHSWKWKMAPCRQPLSNAISGGNAMRCA